MSFLEENERTGTWIERKLPETPALSRILKISNAGEADLYRDISEELETIDAKDRLDRHEVVTNLVTMEYKDASYTYDKFRDLSDKLDKLLFPNGRQSDEDNADFAGAKVMLKTAMLKGINSPFYNMIRAMIFKDNKAKEALLKGYEATHDKEEYDALLNYLADEKIYPTVKPLPKNPIESQQRKMKQLMK